MRLGELKELLENFPPETETKFGYLHSYRGYYEQAAIDPHYDSTIESVLIEINDALNGNVFTGWKGGDFVFNENTPVWAASEGNSSSQGIGGINVKDNKLNLVKIDVSDYQGF